MSGLGGFLISGRPLIVTSRERAISEAARSIENLFSMVINPFSFASIFLTRQRKRQRLMKRLVLIMPLFAAHLSVLRAEPFEQAEVKKGNQCRFAPVAVEGGLVSKDHPLFSPNKVMRIQQSRHEAR